MRNLLWVILVGLLVGGTPAVVVAQQGATTHVVRRGENLTAIAKRYGVSVARLRSQNALNARGVIRPGQRLVIRPAPARTGAAPAAGGDRARTHVVRRGETLTAIGRRYGVSIEALQAANDLNARGVIFAGQRLEIPSRETAVVLDSVMTIELGDLPAIGGIGAIDGNDAAIDVSVVESDSVARGAKAPAPMGEHVVVRGETVAALARRYGTSVGAIREANDLPASGLIRVGQRLRVPGAVARSAAERRADRLAGRYVVIDPGHGGPVQRGARSGFWPAGLYEADITFAVSARVRDLLVAEGVPVRMTRPTGTEGPTLPQRAAMCGKPCLLFVSIHVNSMPTDPNPSRGLEAYIPPQRSVVGASRTLALGLTRAVSAATGQPVLRVNPRRLGVLTRATRPAVLFELGFATHPEEGPWLLRDETHDTQAKAIADAIVASLDRTTPR